MNKVKWLNPATIPPSPPFQNGEPETALAPFLRELGGYDFLYK